MGRYHNLFYAGFAIVGIVYFCIVLFQGVIIRIVPSLEFLIEYIVVIPGIILFVLSIILVTAIIVCCVKRIGVILRSRLRKIWVPEQ